MNTLLLRVAGVVVTLSTLYGPLTYAQEIPELEPGNHPVSRSFESAFPEKVIPLDATLPWVTRFNGDETFNEDHQLEMATTVVMNPESTHTMDHDHSMDHGKGMDAEGVIKKIQAGQNKIKIKHGPIDKLGMPGMTMVFKVEDAALLEGLSKGGEVMFSVDNTSGGFVITDIKPAAK